MSNIKRYSDENREAIERYLEAGGGDSEIVLSDLQIKLLERWRAVDEMLRSRKYKRRGVIANKIIAMFNVSRDTAYRDIVNAEYVFSSTAPLNKKYLIGQRIEFLQSVIEQIYQSCWHDIKPTKPPSKKETPKVAGFLKVVDTTNKETTEDVAANDKICKKEFIIDAEKMEVIARHEAVLQKYIDKYPDFTPPRSPKNINYIIQNNNLNVTSITVEQANENFDKVLKQLEDNDDY
jgi:hypothetical protein